MRLIMVAAPEGRGDDVTQLAFDAGISKVSRRRVESHKAEGGVDRKDVVDIETATPKGKRFVDALLKSDFYKQEDFTISVRSPLSIISLDNVREITKPLPVAATDVFEELFQFSHITYSFVGRIFIAGALLAYGMIEQQILLMIAGLLFLPLLPLLQAIGFGAWTRQRKLALQGLLAFAVAVILLVLAGVTVAAISSPPLRYDDFNSLGVSCLISLVVGVAAGLAMIDDSGKREMIGLAASSQLALIPVRFGICAVFGFPETTGSSEIGKRAVSFLVVVVTLIVASLAVHVLSRTADGALKNVKG